MEATAVQLLASVPFTV
jgi:hypothetical protein